MNRFFYSTLFILGLFSASFSQDDPSGTEVFSKAVRFYKTGLYDSTIATVRAFLKNHGKDPATENLVPIVMEAFLRKGDYAPVRRLFDLYQKKYRSSPFMPRVHYLHGIALARGEKSYDQALEAYSKALDGGVSGDLDTLIIKGTEALCAYALSLDDLHEAGNEQSNNTRIREIARYYEIMKLLSAGDVGKAKNCMGNFKNDYPRSRFEVQIGDLLSSALPKKTVSIGLMAPLSGDDADIGKRVAQGVLLSIDKYNERNQLQIRLITCDTKGQILETVRQTQQLVDRDKVPLIIGPMLSPTATVAAAMLMCKGAVMLTPTATDDGIASLGPAIFQMNITLGVLARKAARYALANLNIREFAIVAPRTVYGATMASVFRDEVTQGGGTVFDEQKFDEGGNDFTAQFVNLRKKLLLRKLNQIDGKARTKLAPLDSLKWADSSVSIGAIFIPAEAEDVVMLAPQVAFNRIKAQFLGSSGWHSQKTVTDGKQYVQNAIISTAFEPDSSWKKWPEFKKEYVSRYGEEPDRVAALGYDAGKISILAIENAGGNAGNTAKIAESIGNTQKYEGTSGVITMDKNTRTNSEAVILKLTANGFVRVQ
jgi:ABC-type branched-subunit amino acid transport system substrate-binding protein